MVERQRRVSKEEPTGPISPVARSRAAVSATFAAAFDAAESPLPPPTRRWRPPNREAGDVVKDHWGAPPPKVESARRGRVRTAVGFTLPKVQTRHQEHSQGRIHGGRVSDYFY